MARTGFQVVNTIEHSAVPVRNMATGRDTVRLLSQIRRRPSPDDNADSTFPQTACPGMMSIVKFPSSPTICFIVTRIDFSPDVNAGFLNLAPYDRRALRFINHRSPDFKSFGAHGMHQGTIRSIDQGKWFKVVYDDGDGRHELQRGLASAFANPRLSLLPFMPASFHRIYHLLKSGRCSSYAAPVKQHPDDAINTFLRRDADFISNAFELNPDGTIPGHIINALEDSVAVCPPEVPHYCGCPSSSPPYWSHVSRPALFNIPQETARPRL